MKSLAIRVIHSRTSVVIAVLLLGLCCFVTCTTDSFNPISGNRGVVLSPPYEWITSPVIQTIAAFALNCLIIAGMILINRMFNILRSMTYIYTSIFAIYQFGSPDVTALFSNGPLVCIIVCLCSMLMLSCYASPSSARRIFLIFFLLSAAVTTQYSYIFYVPAFIFGCIQMRIFSRRTLVAAILGIITPWWLLLGFGVISPYDIHLPEFGSIFTNCDFSSALVFIAPVALTILIAITAYLLNFVKALSYNAQTRAKNGFMLVIFAVTLVAMIADFINLDAYITTLNYCAAFMTARLFIQYRTPRSWIWLAAMASVYAVLFLCNIYGNF